MPILETLTLGEATRIRIVSRENTFRTKLMDAIDLQLIAASAEIKGEPFQRIVKRWINSSETGGRQKVDVQVRFRPWWWKDTTGAVFLELRYANKALEIKPGKSAVSVGSIDKLIPTLEQIKKAVAEGELDKPLKALQAIRRKEINPKLPYKPVK